MAQRKRSELEGNIRFVVLLGIAMLALQTFVVRIFYIPSESMLPRLLIGDYLAVEKWPYGYSRWSVPWGFIPVPGRLATGTPERGDVVVFRSPEPQPGDTDPEHASHDVIKRVIGVGGDTIQMRGGRLILNGVAVPKVADGWFDTVSSGGFACAGQDAPAGTPCRIARFRETLPGGRSYDVLDLGRTEGDDTGLFQVPAGTVFLMGDDRDDSADSRFAPPTGMGYIPLDRVEGRAAVTVFSWLKPWTWFSAARWRRIGAGF